MSKSRKNRFDSNERVNRLDLNSEKITKTKRTSQGFLRIPAVLTRVGVLKYTRADGSTVRELRHPDDVNDVKSLDTLSGAPVTENHKGMINPNNVSAYQTGFVGEQIRNDAGLVHGTLTVQTEATITKIENGDLIELSPGYSCAIDPTPGTFEGERYDQIQRNIVYNHIALLPPGAGRSGPEVALRMDAAVSGLETINKPKKIEGEETLKMKKIKFRLDGITYEIEVAENLATTLETALAKIESERTDSKTALEKIQGALDAAKKENEDLQKRFDAATAPETVEQAVKERADVINKAKELVKEIKTDGLTVDEIKKQALLENGFDSERLDAVGAGYIDGAFEALKIPETEKPKLPAISPAPREDSKDEEIVDEFDSASAHERMIKRNQEMYKS